MQINLVWTSMLQSLRPVNTFIFTYGELQDIQRLYIRTNIQRPLCAGISVMFQYSTIGEVAKNTTDIRDATILSS